MPEATSPLASTSAGAILAGPRMSPRRGLVLYAGAILAIWQRIFFLQIHIF
jgi:hypothetical protein